MASGQKSKGDLTSHQLTEEETFLYGFDFDPIRTLTWFKGDYDSARIILDKRMKLIVEKNPWLQGKITSKYKIFKGSKCYLSYSKGSAKSDISVDENLEVILPKESTIKQKMPYKKLVSNLHRAGLMIKNGPKEAIFKATVIPCSQNPQEEFALLVQQSHIAGDGSTYYKLLNMLCSSNTGTITELIPERISGSNEKQIATLGAEEESYSRSAANTIKLVGSILTNVIIRRKTKYRFGWVDPIKMKDIKETMAEEGGVPFVSTNDVITSWFMKQTESPIGLMAFNWRNRLDGHSSLHAGNYSGIMFYKKDDFATPALIRKSLKTYKRVVTKEEQMPKWYQDVVTSSAIVSNWSTFAKPNEIEGCEEKSHVPICSMPYVPSKLHALVIFRAGPGKIGLLETQGTGVDHLESAPFLIDES